MPKLVPIPRRILIKKLKKLSFLGPYAGARHQYMERGTEKIFIPNPHGKDIGIPLVKQIIEQLGISGEELLRL